jgi:uncharacterized protein (DUF4213/DUF364 family)
MSQTTARGSVLRETIADITRILGPEMDHITVERLVVGLFFTGVKLSSGAAGTASTARRFISEAVCCPDLPALGREPGQLRGSLARDLLRETEAPGPVRRAIGIATMNALAEMCWQRQPSPDVELRAGVDAFDAVTIQPGENVVIVGAFVPFLRALKQAGQRFTVLEMDPATLKPDEMPFYRHASEAADVVPSADVVLMTGTTLLNDTMEDLLALCRAEARVVVVGPTVSLWPTAYLRRGADIMGGARVTRPDEFLDTLAEGGSGRHFFGRSAEKVVLVRRTPKVARVAA